MAVFKIVEIMDMGIEKEKKRKEFYGKVKDMFEDSRLKNLFSDLEKWEEEHVHRFEEIKRELGEEQTTLESYPGEMEAYIHAFLDNKLYYEIDKTEFAQKVKTPENALIMAMEFEKDAIIFFTELYAFVHEKHKPTIKTLIDEEKQHLVYLYNLKKEIVK